MEMYRSFYGRDTTLPVSWVSEIPDGLEELIAQYRIATTAVEEAQEFRVLSFDFVIGGDAFRKFLWG